MEIVHEIPTKLRVRLMVALPALLALFMLVVGIGLLLLFDVLVLPPEVPVDAARKIVMFWLLIAAGLAFLGNFTAGMIISRYLRGFMVKVDRMIRRGGLPGGEVVASSEIGALGIMLDEANVTLDRFINDSYIIEHLPEAVITLNSLGDIIALNNNAAKLLRVTPGMNGFGIRDFIPETRVSRVFYELLDRGLKGKPVPLQVVRLPIRTREDRDYWVEFNPLRMDSHLPNALSIIIKDHGSIAAIRKQIRKLERLAAMGQIASSMAHEVRNPLGAIRTLMELIQEDLAADDSKAPYVEEILKQINRLNLLIEDTLAFSRDATLNLQEVVIPELLASVISTVKLSFADSDVVLYENYRTETPSVVRGDPEKLFQAFLNLVVNGIEACGDAGWVSISTACDLEENETSNTVCINIADNGRGIAPEHMGRIFEPFYTTKPSGTGIGLALAHNIITAHGGKIDIYSELGHGATFSVVLPESHHFLELDEEESEHSYA